MSLRFDLLLEKAPLRYLFTAYSQATGKVLSLISFDAIALTQSSKNISSSIRDPPPQDWNGLACLQTLGASSVFWLRDHL